MSLYYNQCYITPTPLQTHLGYTKYTVTLSKINTAPFTPNDAQVDAAFSDSHPGHVAVAHIPRVRGKGGPDKIKAEKFKVRLEPRFPQRLYPVIFIRTNPDYYRSLCFVPCTCYIPQTLMPGQLLSDDVINPYFSLLAARDETVRINNHGSVQHRLLTYCIGR